MIRDPESYFLSIQRLFGEKQKVVEYTEQSYIALIQKIHDCYAQEANFLLIPTQPFSEDPSKYLLSIKGMSNSFVNTENFYNNQVLSCRSYFGTQHHRRIVLGEEASRVYEAVNGEDGIVPVPQSKAELGPYGKKAASRLTPLYEDVCIRYPLVPLATLTGSRESRD